MYFLEFLSNLGRKLNDSFSWMNEPIDNYFWLRLLIQPDNYENFKFLPINVRKSWLVRDGGQVTQNVSFVGFFRKNKNPKNNLLLRISPDIWLTQYNNIFTIIVILALANFLLYLLMTSASHCTGFDFRRRPIHFLSLTTH